MDGRDKIPSRGWYVSPYDGVGEASIYNKAEAGAFREFENTCAVSEQGVCDDYEELKKEKGGEE